MSTHDLNWLTPEIEEAQAHHRARVAALYAGQRLDPPVAICGRIYGRSHGLWGTNETDMLAEPEAWLEDVLRGMAAGAAQAADRATFRPLSIEVDPLGVHYIDALFGARTCFHAGQVWSDPLDCDPADIAPPDLPHSSVFLASLALARRAIARTQGRVLVTTPVLSCPANIGMNLFGERLLEAMIERPAAARHALRVITDAILACARAFAQAIPDAVRRGSVACSRCAPPGFGQIDGCATQLVSARHYEEFLAPPDAEVLRASPHGGMIHLCGAHAQHIPAWSRMPELRAVQLNDRAAEDLARYAGGLRPDQILYVAPTPSMPVERILRITRGERVVLQCDGT